MFRTRGENKAVLLATVQSSEISERDKEKLPLNILIVAVCDPAAKPLTAPQKDFFVALLSEQRGC